MYYYLAGEMNEIGQVFMMPLKDEEMVEYDLYKSISKTEAAPFIAFPEGSGGRTTRPRVHPQLDERFVRFLETLFVRASRHGSIKPVSRLIKLQSVEIIETENAEVTIMDDKHYLRTLPPLDDYRLPDELVYQQVYQRTDGYQSYTVISTVDTEVGRHDDHLEGDRWLEMLDRY